MTTLDELFGARTALVVDGVVGAAAAAGVRAALDAAGWQRYRLLDRGAHDFLDGLARAAFAAELLGAVAAVASSRTGRTLVVVAARALRLGPGDYLLGHHDRVHADHPIEATLDLSPAAVPDAEVHYRRRGQLFFRVASSPGALALVERGPGVTCHHTYVSKLHRRASIVRVVALLRDRA
ncbi:MAG TPA: hypothetical protein VHE35_06325 [Kofleriaceae bacterium]|nr:hypothetical protein [Kofleriaceae bacterium]